MSISFEYVASSEFQSHRTFIHSVLVDNNKKLLKAIGLKQIPTCHIHIISLQKDLDGLHLSNICLIHVCCLDVVLRCFAWRDSAGFVSYVFSSSHSVFFFFIFMVKTTTHIY